MTSATPSSARLTDATQFRYSVPAGANDPWFRGAIHLVLLMYGTTHFGLARRRLSSFAALIL